MATSPYLDVRILSGTRRGVRTAAAAELFRGDPCRPYSHTAFGTHATSDWLTSPGKCAPDTVGRTGLQRRSWLARSNANLLGRSLEPRPFCKTRVKAAEAMLPFFLRCLHSTFFAAYLFTGAGGRRATMTHLVRSLRRSTSHNNQKPPFNRSSPP